MKWMNKKSDLDKFSESIKNTNRGDLKFELLTPLRSMNINSSLHSFYDFREIKENLENLLKAESNLVFYVLHQNFMCDDEHKEFFKNMVGRFFNLPESLWDYYNGGSFINHYSNKGSLLGLVLLENCELYQEHKNGTPKVLNHKFKAENSQNSSMLYFNKHSLRQIGGITNPINEYCNFFYPCNVFGRSESSFDIRHGFERDYEYGRFDSTADSIYTSSIGAKVSNPWFICTYDYLESITEEIILYEAVINKSTYASLGIEKKDIIIERLKKQAKKINVKFDDEWIPKFDAEEEKQIRSLSQTFKWTKDYIFQNEKNLNLNVLGLNLTVPWDFEMVKFFIKRGYGGSMSENKAVFEKVFKSILTEEIVNMLFKLEYEKF